MSSTVDAPSGLLERLFRVRPGEERKTAVLFVHLAAASGIFVLGRTARDTLFLSRFPDPSRLLPWMFVLFGVVSAMVASVYGRLADRFDRTRVLAVAGAVAAGSFLLFRLLFTIDAGWVSVAFWVWTEVAANLLVISFWTFVGDLADARDAKRLAPTIGSARILGVVAFGLLGAAAVRAIGTLQLLVVLAILAAATALLPRLLAHEPRVRHTEPLRRRRKIEGREPSPLTDPYVAALAAFLLVIFVALTLGDYQFKVLARRNYDQDALAHFFSLFYAGAGTVGFLLQIFVTPRLIGRFGAPLGLGVMPGLFGTAAAALIALPGLAVGSIMKFADNGLQFTVHETSLQALYVPVPTAVKARVRALLEAAIKPLAYGVGGLLLVLLAPRVGAARVELLGIASLVLVAGALALVPRIRRRYLEALEKTVGRSGVLDGDRSVPLDGAGRKLLLAALSGPDPRPALRALDAVEGVDGHDLRAALAKLVGHEAADVRGAAFRRLAALGETSALPAMRRALADPEPSVRLEAVRGLMRIGGDEAVDDVVPLLVDGSRRVRVEALSGLFGAGGLAGSLAGAPRLGHLLGSPDPHERAEATDVLRRLGREAYRPLRPLLDDSDPNVARGALRAAAAVADPRLVEPLVARLADRRSRSSAAAALAAVGLPAIPALEALLLAPETKRSVRLVIPRILREIPVLDSVEALRAAWDFPDSHVRLRVYSALGRLRAELRLAPRPTSELVPRLRAELAEVLEVEAGWAQCREIFTSPLLALEHQFRRSRGERRVLRLLEQRYERRDLDLVRRSLRDAGRRAQATELLDGLLDPALRAVVLPLFDDGALGERLRLAESAGVRPHLYASPLEVFRKEMSHPNGFIRFLWMDAVRFAADPATRPEVEAAIADPDPLVREAAARALVAVVPSAERERFLAQLIADPIPAVSAAARAAAHQTEVPMISTVEKILFLESVPLFSMLSGENLAPLARAAEVIEPVAGVDIFREGEPADALFVIMRGTVIIDTGGHAVATIGEREAFGEMGVLDGSPRAATAKAGPEVTLLRIGSEEFLEILHEQPELAEGILKILAARLREADRRLGGQEGEETRSRLRRRTAEIAK